MRKGLIVLLAAVMVVAFTLPAMAEHTMSGFVRVKARVQQNYQTTGSSGGLFILPVKDAPTQSFVEQRQRFIFDWNTENAGARGYFEIDFGAWGDSAYTVGRNQGAGLEGDSVNLETKNFYIWFNVPNTSLKVTAGLQNVSDSYDGVIVGVADMAGIFLTGKMEPVSYRLGWAKFQENGTVLDDDVDFYMAEVKFSPTKEAKLGINLYLLRDAAGVSATGGANSNVTTAFSRIADDYDAGAGLGAFTYAPSNFYYIGLDGSLMAGPATLSGWFFYNTGKIEKVTNAFFGLTGEDVDVKAWAAQLRGDMNLGPGKFFLAGAYVTGTDENDSDYKSPIVGNNYALAGSYPLYKWDLQILFPNGDDINNSSALAYDVQNKGRGVMAFAAGYSQKFSDMLSGKIGIGYLTDVENPVGSPVKKHKAFEVNANVNYSLVKGVDLGLYGAYASLTDWENYVTVAGNTTADLTSDADDIFKLYARLNYSF